MRLADFVLAVTRCRRTMRASRVASLIPQPVFNTFSQNGSAQADPAGSDDYGVVDEKA
jgi:hypothetical protein